MVHSSDSSDDGNKYSKSRTKRKAKTEKKRFRESSASRPAAEKEDDAFVFKQLDSGGTVYLQDLGDPRLRKKLRHLFRSLLVGEVDGERGKGWKKLPTFEKPLAKFVKRRCKNLRQRVDAMPPQLPVQSGAPAASLTEQEAGDSVPAFDPEEAERKADEAVLRWRSEEAAAAREASPQRGLAAEASGHVAQPPIAGAPAVGVQKTLVDVLHDCCLARYTC
ncbi:hypothetical protein ACSSS7_004080 [Eimeria intestinalis]